MIFYDYWRSIRLAGEDALNIKQISVERRAVNLAPQGDVGAQHSADFRALNPMSQVPVLVIEGPPGPPRTLTQSMAILDTSKSALRRHPCSPRIPGCADAPASWARW